MKKQMDIISIIIIGAIVALFGVILILQNKGKGKKADSADDKNIELISDWIKTTKGEMTELRREMHSGLDKSAETLNRQLSDTNKAVSDRLDKAASFMKSIGEDVGRVRELSRSMKDLQEFLQSPKIRGNIGEQVLKDLISQIIPASNFKIQHKFKDGQVVDAIVKTDNGLISIDSKFPMENAKKIFKAEGDEEKLIVRREFLRDVRKHISDISKRYILPSEGTVDFAIMYVPSESVYYEVVAHNEELIEYGQEKKVFIVSPNSFYYFLQAIMLGLRGKKIEEASKKILETLTAIQQESKEFGKHVGILNRHITNAKGAMDNVNTKYNKLSGQIDGVKLLE